MKRTYPFVILLVLLSALATYAFDVNSDLIEAAKKSYIDAVKTLPNQDTDVDARDNNGRTALMRAAAYISFEEVQALLNRGADVNAKDNDGRTVLMHGTASSLNGMVSLLLEKGADVNAKDNNGRTALMHAAANGRIIAMEQLLGKGTDVDAKDNDGRTALMYAESKGNPYGIKLLTEDQSLVGQMIRNIEIKIDPKIINLYRSGDIREGYVFDSKIFKTLTGNNQLAIVQFGVFTKKDDGGNAVDIKYCFDLAWFPDLNNPKHQINRQGNLVDQTEHEYPKKLRVNEKGQLEVTFTNGKIIIMENKLLNERKKPTSPKKTHRTKH